jgi:acyltransferase
MASRDSAIDGIRCVGICAIILGHFCTWLQGWLYVFHLPLFLVLGGLLYRKDERPYGEYFCHKFRSLMYPFYLYGIALLAYWIIFESYYRHSGQGFAWYKGFIGLLYAGDGNDFLLRFGGAIWFLPCYFVVVVIYEALSRISKSDKVIQFSLLIVASLCGYYYNLSKPHLNLPFGFNQALSCLPWFWIGTVIAHAGFVEYMNEQKSKKQLLLMSLIFLCLSILSGPPIDLYSCTLGKSYIGLYSQSLAGILFCISLGIMLKEYKIVQLIGVASLFIMCTHQPVGRILYKILELLTHVPYERFAEGHWAPIVCTGILGVCTVAYWMGQRILTRIKVLNF